MSIPYSDIQKWEAENDPDYRREIERLERLRREVEANIAMPFSYALTCPNVHLPPEKYIPPPTNRNQRPMRPKASKKKRGRA